MKDKIFRLALRITLNRAEAEDVTQDVILRVWEQRDSLGEIRSLEAYMLTAARNMALDRQAKAENTNASLDEVQTEAPDSTLRPDERLEHEEKLARVRQLIDALPETQRSALQLRDVEGHSYSEIAEITGLTEANVKVLIFRARQAIKKQFEKIENYGL